MTPTTSKLGADMTDESLEELASACGLYGVRKAAAAYAREVIALLARQPAAIDKQEARDAFDAWNDSQTALEFDDAEAENHARFIFTAGYNAAPLANEASKPAVRNCQTGWADFCLMAKHDGVTCPSESCDIDDGIRAAPSVEQDDPTDYEALEREHLGDAEKRTGIYAPSVEQDERGAFDLPKALRMLADEHIHNPALSMRLLGLARAASTSANVAQGAEMHICGECDRQFRAAPPVQTAPTDDVLMQAIADTAARGHVWASRALSNFRAAVREAATSPNDA